MSSTTGAPYEDWNLELPFTPLRSILYPLKPIGTGTPLVECLTSYISRLAMAHGVFPGTLMGRIVAPFVAQSPRYRRCSRSMVAGKIFTQTFNGTTQQQTAAAVDALECLTLQHSLRFLTLLTWEGVFSTSQLLRQTRAWCPACLEEWRSTNQVIYEPLLWTLRVVTLCPRHQCELRTTCPHAECGSPAPWLAWRSYPGYCPVCGRWLGTPVYTEAKMDEASMRWQQWVSEQLGELLALAPTVVDPPPRTRIHEVLRHALQQMEQNRRGRHKEFASRLGVMRSTYSTWLSRGEIPRIETLLSICARWRISLYDCFFKDVSNLSLHLEWDVPTPPKNKSQPKARGFWSRPQTRETLETILKNGEFPPPSLKTVAQRLGCRPASLRQHHGELCDAISTQHRAYVQEKKQTDLQRYCEEVRQAAHQLAAQGKRPTRKKLAEVLKKPGILRSPEIRESWQKVLREIDGKVS